MKHINFGGLILTLSDKYSMTLYHAGGKYINFLYKTFLNEYTGS